MKFKKMEVVNEKYMESKYGKDFSGLRGARDIFGNAEDNNEFADLRVFTGYQKTKRAFLNLYPSIEKALVRSSIDIDMTLIPRSILHDLEWIEVRVCDSSSRNSFLLHYESDLEKASHTIVETGMSPSMIVRIYSKRNFDGIDRLHGSSSFINGCYLAYRNKNPNKLLSFDETLTHAFIDEYRIAVGLLLLACEDSYFEPILLNRDKNRQLTGGNLEKAIERAKKRGVLGFNVGREMQETESVSPHMRRPHFAIRWTGPGGKIPRIVPVKAAIVNKKILTQIPTGYDNEGAENVTDSTQHN